MQFLAEHVVEFKHCLLDKHRWGKLYLADIFGLLNTLITKMLGRNEAIQSVTDKLQAFQLKIELWRNKLHESLRQMCHLTAAVLSENDQLMSLKKTISYYLAILQQKFLFYFPDLNIFQQDWERNSFIQYVIRDVKD